MTSTGETGIAVTPSPRVMEEAAARLGVRVADLKLTKLAGDASTRSYFRAASPGIDPASVVVAIYTDPFDDRERAEDHLARLESSDPSARLTYANDPRAHVEVTKLLLDAGLPVPPIVAVLGDARALIFEDVGDVRLQDWLTDHSAGESSNAYRRAVEFIVEIQEATERAEKSGSICSRLAFDEAKLRWELGFFFANYFNKYLGVRLDAATAKAVQADFKTMCAELAARPRVLVHRDYHTRNLMMRGEEMFIIDHQDARLGPVSYDVASLLRDPYACLDGDAVSEMVEYFIEEKGCSFSPIAGVEEFRLEFELMTIQRMLKAVGTYAFQIAVKENPVYGPYIEPAINSAVAAMKVLGRFDAARQALEETRKTNNAR